MLKFRFRKQNIRRRSNSCPNLERPDDEETISGQNAENVKPTNPTQDFERTSIESGSEVDDESDSVPRKERLKFQRSIRRMKKKEKEKQENSEKNLLSMDDYYGRLALLKEWLFEQGKRDVDKISSPKLKSHFKTFVKLWNKRKLPPKYYRSCCVDAVEASSNPDDMSSPLSTLPLLYGDISKLPSYHRFPPVDEPDTPWRARFGSPSHFKPRPISDLADSPFSTFGKSLEESEPSESILSLQVTKSDTSPTKFASISRSTTATGMFKPSAMPLSPKLHPVLSPTCPLSFTFSEKAKNIPSSFAFESMNAPGEGRQSPAYMCVKDAIRYESPEYSQIVEPDQKDLEPIYYSLSPFRQEGQTQDLSAQNGPRKKQGSNRRRSKSMEDIYAIPSRLRTMKPSEAFAPSPSERDASLTLTPPVPAKNIDLHMSHPLAKQTTSPILKASEKYFTLTFDQFVPNGLNQDVMSKSKAAVDISPGRPIALSPGRPRDNLQAPYWQENINNSPSLLPFTGVKSKGHVSVTSERPGFKRRSQDKENLEENFEMWKKAKSADSNQPSPNLAKPSILTGSLSRTTRTPVPAAENQTSRRLSILQIKQLDSSPTFPRRRIKRRSSNLSTTPGKGLTFGNKTPSFAKSSPRRVSFAKDVNDSEKKSTPKRSAGRKTNQDKRGDRDVKRQSQDREEFESFWSSHSPVKEKYSSPKEGSPGNVWSPPKWLSPPKQASKIPQEEAGKNLPNERQFSPARSKDQAQGSPTKSSQSNDTNDGLGLSLSPSKLMSRIKRNLSSSLLQKEYESGSNSCSKPDTDDRCSVQKTCNVPKSILKNKDHVKSSSDLPPSVPDKEDETLPPRQFGRRVLGPPLPSSQKQLKSKNSSSSLKPTSPNSRFLVGLKNSSSNLEKNTSDGVSNTENLSDKFSTNKYLSNFESFYSTLEKNQEDDCGIGKTKTLFDQVSLVDRGVKSSGSANKILSSVTEETTNPQNSPTYEGKFPDPKNKISSFPVHDQSDECSDRPSVKGKSEFDIIKPASTPEDNPRDYTLDANHQYSPSCIYEKRLKHSEASAVGFNSELIYENVDRSNPVTHDQTDQLSGTNLMEPSPTGRSRSHEQTHPPAKSDSNEECKLERLESMKASPNIIENDSWITARRKSSVRLKKKITSESQIPKSDFIAEENIVNDTSFSTKELEPDNSDQGINDSKSNIISSEVKADVSNSFIKPENETDVESEILPPSWAKPSTIDSITNSSSCLVIDCTNQKNLKYDVTTLSSNQAVSSVQPENAELSQNTFFQQEFEVKSERKTDERFECPVQTVAKFRSDRKIESNKENDEVKNANPKPCRPKPKPAVLPKPSMRLTRTSSSQQKLCTNTLVNSRPTVKKRNSLGKKESVGTPRKSSSFRNNLSVWNIAAHKKKNPLAEEETVRNLDTSGPSDLPIKERKRTSLTPKKRRSQSNNMREGEHPHIISFAQRRKFFQQIEESSASSNPLGEEGKLTQSSSKLQNRPRPPVRPKPRLSRIVSFNK